MVVEGKITKMTFSEYDELTEMFDQIDGVEKEGKIETNKRMAIMPVKKLWPTLEQIDLFEKDPPKWIFFACFLYERTPSPKNKNEEYRKKTLADFIWKYLYLE